MSHRHPRRRIAALAAVLSALSIVTAPPVAAHHVASTEPEDACADVTDGHLSASWSELDSPGVWVVSGSVTLAAERCPNHTYSLELTSDYSDGSSSVHEDALSFDGVTASWRHVTGDQVTTYPPLDGADPFVCWTVNVTVRNHGGHVVERAGKVTFCTDGSSGGQAWTG